MTHKRAVAGVLGKDEQGLARGERVEHSTDSKLEWLAGQEPIVRGLKEGGQECKALAFVEASESTRALQAKMEA